MVQEEAESRSIHLCVSTTRLTGHYLVAAMRMYLRHAENKKHEKAHEGAHGKVKVKELLRDGDGVESMPLADGKLRDFERIANKYGVTFSVIRDKNESPPRYLVFFKAKDADAMSQVVKEYTEREMRRSMKPSILKQLEKIKDVVKEMAGRVRNKEQEHTR